jgi:predicted dehydrogenase
MTISGSIAQQNAEILAVVVLAQLVNPGLPIIYCGRLAMMEPRTGISVWGGVGFATHDVSVVTHLIDEEPIEVTASGQSYVRKGIYDVVFLTIHFPGDVMAHLHVSWLDPHKIRQLTVVGDKKMAVLDDTQATEKLRIYDKGVDFTPSYRDYGESLTIRVGDIYIPKIDLVEPLKAECQHFLDCITKGEKPLTDGESGLKVVRVLEAAEQSLREHSRAVTVPR